MKTKTLWARAKSKGFTFVELMLVLAITTVAAIAVATKTVRETEYTQAQMAADNIMLVGRATAAYINKNPGALYAATVTGYADLTITDLRNDADLSANVTAAPPWGGGYIIRVQRVGSAPSYRYEALVYTEKAWTWTVAGTVRARQDLVGVAASKIGGAGGVSLDASGPSGVKGAWTKPLGMFVPTAPYLATGGQLFYNVTYGLPAWDTQYLRLDGTNKMQGNLNLGGKSINNADNVQVGGALNVTGATALANATATGNIAANGQVQGGTVHSMGDLTANGNAAIAGIIAAAKVSLTDAINEGDACGVNGQVSRDATGLVFSCQSGVWKKSVKTPNSYRFMFTSSQTWTVPQSVSSAFVTMAGGGGSGAGWRIISTTMTGHSGGYIFSQPVNFVPGETVQVTVGKGGQGYGPVSIGPTVLGHPYYIYAAPSGDDGLGGYPGGTSSIASPSLGTLMECNGGSGAASGGIDTYSGSSVAGGLPGATFGGGRPPLPAPNRVATGPYASARWAGACGLAGYGIGNGGTTTWGLASGNRDGGKTPFGYGSGGDVSISGCHVTYDASYVATCVWGGSGRDGVVFIDVLY